jgi:RNA polymerase-binding protein DksA
MARAGASKSLSKPAPRARGTSEAGTPSASAKAAKATGKKAAEPAASTKKAPAKAAKTVKAGKAAQASKVSKPPSPAKPAKAVKAVKAAKAPTKATKAVKATKPAPAKVPAKAKTSTVARNTRPRKSPEVAQVAEARGRRGGAATKAPPTAAAAVPEKVEPSFPAKTLDKLRRLLEEERETYVRQARDLAAEAEALASEREPGDTQFDEESGEGDTLNVERERDLALSASATQAVEEIDRALRRMDTGHYGICERCGKKIAVARLEALPFAALCIECKSREERRR